MSEDVLRTYDVTIEFARGLHLPATPTIDTCDYDWRWMAIRDLAAELKRARADAAVERGLNKRLEIHNVDLSAEVRVSRDTISALWTRVTVLEGEKHQLGVLRDAAESHLEEMKDENVELQARVAELETQLAHEHQRSEDWKYLSGGNCDLLEKMTDERDALQARVAGVESDAELGQMVRAAKEAVLDYEMPFHQCTCCGGKKEYDDELYRFVSKHNPGCPWAALVRVLGEESQEEPC